MKKLFILLAGVFALTACNKKTELGPEYKTPAEISNVIFPEIVSPDQEVPVSAQLSCQYRLGQAVIIYCLNDKVEESKTVSVESYLQTPKFEAVYSGKIPAQPVGTKVSFQVYCVTFYSVPSASEIYSYTVQELPVPEA